MKKIIKFSGLIILGFVAYLVFTNYPKLDLISGFSAKSVASCRFLDNRDLKSIEKQDNDIDLIDLAKNKINDAEKFATASVYGFKERKAIYREGLGATLIDDDFDETKAYEIPKRTAFINNLDYPFGNLEPKNTVFENVNYPQLNAAVNSAFDNKNENIKRTRSVLILYKGKLLTEKYAAGFNKNSKLLGWSMTKSLTATMFGILQKQSKFDINKPAPIAEWKNDKRAKITTNDLLHMNSGLEWEENYGTISDVTKMLFLEKDMGAVQLKKEQLFAPNTHWNYSSGTTNLLSKILRMQFQTHQEYLDFWYSELIDKIGMNSMIVETDMTGNFVGSSYGWATTRDWARFGQLYLNNGLWNDEQIFDPNWAKYVATPTPTSNGIYGAHFWLNNGQNYPDVPKDMYHCSGYQGQMVYIIPSANIVVVRMGLSEDFDFNRLLKDILASIKK